MVAQLHIVGDVRIGKDMIIGSDGRDLAIAGCAVDRDIFTEGVVIADLGAGNAPFPFQVLGLETNAGEREELIASANRGVAVNNNMRIQPAAGANHSVAAHNTIGANLTPGADLRAGMDHRRRMDKATANAGFPGYRSRRTAARDSTRVAN